MLTLGKLRSRVGKMKNASYGGGAMTAKGKAQVKRDEGSILELGATTRVGAWVASESKGMT
jgi:hypothetical protein